MESHYKIIWKRQAKRDLIRIWNDIYHASLSIDSANLWIDKITTAGKGLDIFPMRNSFVIHRAGHKYWHIKVGKYYIYYEILTEIMTIKIVRIDYDRKDVNRLKF